MRRQVGNSRRTAADRMGVARINPSEPAMRRFAFVLPLMSLLLCVVLQGCGGGGGGPDAVVTEGPTLADFPPMANDAPPGAAASTLATAQALGRGVNFGNMLESPTEGSWGITVNDTVYDEFIDQVATAGFKTVRLPVRFSNHAATDAAATLDAAFLNHVESLVDRMLARGLHVILDFHHYRQFDGDAPDAGETPVAADVVDVRFLTIWRQVATRFSGKSDHLLFELYNEAHGRLTSSKWNDMAARALAVIRQTNPTRVVLLGGTSYNSAWTLDALKVPNDPYIIATFHHYDPFNFTHQGADWISPVMPTGVTCCTAEQQATMLAPFEAAHNWSVAHGYPLHLGEFGAYQMADMDSRVAFTRQMRDLAEARGISWTYWELAAGFGVYDPVAHAWRTPLKDALLADVPR